MFSKVILSFPKLVLTMPHFHLLLKATSFSGHLDITENEGKSNSFRVAEIFVQINFKCSVYSFS